MAGGSCARFTAVGDQHAVTAELHGQRGIGGRADAGVEDDRDVHGLAEQRDVVRIADTEPAADG